MTEIAAKSKKSSASVKFHAVSLVSVMAQRHHSSGEQSSEDGTLRKKFRSVAIVSSVLAKLAAEHSNNAEP